MRVRVHPRVVARHPDVTEAAVVEAFEGTLRSRAVILVRCSGLGLERTRVGDYWNISRWRWSLMGGWFFIACQRRRRFSLRLG